MHCSGLLYQNVANDVSLEKSIYDFDGALLSYESYKTPSKKLEKAAYDHITRSVPYSKLYNYLFTLS